MVIVFVEDNYLYNTNGTSVSTRRFREELIKRGHTVRVLALGVDGKDMYGLKEHKVPLVSAMARKNNMHFAQFDKKIVTEAFTGADLVHLIFPWQFERKCLKLAREMGIPVCGAFHCQPENITYNMGIKLFGIVNTCIYFLFKIWLYGKIENIHCPSPFAAEELRKHKYHARLHIISNGILDVFKPASAAVKQHDGLIRILMVGRLSEEKRQDLLIKAVKHSKYRDSIQLQFVGRGPLLKKYQKLGTGLRNPPQFAARFISQDELLYMIHKADLYVHPSEVELESLSCLEAIACGKVPVISDSKKSAAPQFALDNRSLFKKGSYLDLRDKLDYWIEHPEERERMGGEYAQLSAAYNIRNSVIKIEKLFEDVIRDFKTQVLIGKDKHLRKYNDQVKRNNHIKEFICGLFYFAIAIPILCIVNRYFFGLKIVNREAIKKLKKTGAVTICNHIHEMDSTVCAVGLLSRKLIYVSQPSNFTLGIAGIFVDILGSVPSPSTPREVQSFIYSLSKLLRKGRLVHFYPEGKLLKYDKTVRGFQRGAFYLAVDAQVPILPMRILLRPPDGLLKYFRKKPCFTLVFGDPIYPNAELLKNEAIKDMLTRAENAMQSLAV